MLRTWDHSIGNYCSSPKPDSLLQRSVGSVSASAEAAALKSTEAAAGLGAHPESLLCPARPVTGG